MGTICLSGQAVVKPIRRGKKCYSREARRSSGQDLVPTAVRAIDSLAGWAIGVSTYSAYTLDGKSHTHQGCIALTPLAEKSEQSSKALTPRQNQQQDDDNSDPLFHPSFHPSHPHSQTVKPNLNRASYLVLAQAREEPHWPDHDERHDAWTASFGRCVRGQHIQRLRER